MINTNDYKSKKFLFSILSLVLISIILISSINLYITTSLFQEHTNKQIQDIKEEYTEYNKLAVQKEVNILIDSIEFEIQKIEEELKHSLQQKVKTALYITNFAYNKYKNSLSKEEIKKKIVEVLATLKFNDQKNSHYFVYDDKTKIILGHPLKDFIGRDMTKVKDDTNQNIILLDSKVLEKEKIGFNKVYFNKFDNEKKQSSKIRGITRFEELDLVIGSAQYLDVIEKQTKKYVLERFSKLKNKDRTFFILDIHNINGGVDFATILFSLNTPTLVGKKISDNDRDVKGNLFRKNFLKLLRENGSGYTEYWYKKASSSKILSKMSYIHLQKDWNWVIGSGFYFDDLDEKILLLEESINIHTNNSINKTIIWVFTLSFLAVLIAIFVSIQIDKTIKKYTDKIISYEHNKIQRERLLIQQNKLASMGEMIGNIAHQWRQPLSVISSSATGIKLKSELDMIEAKEIEETMTSINNATQFLSQTIDDFRTFSNPNNSKINEFEISSMIDKTFKLLGSDFDSRNMLIIKNIENNSLLSLENELIQVLINILNNTKDCFDIKKIEKKLITINSYKKDKSIYIEILDNAGGIDKDIIDRIFEPYFTTKHQYQGTGIGLYMSLNIVKSHLNGNITVNNEDYIYEDTKYRGAKFTICIN